MQPRSTCFDALAQGTDIPTVEAVIYEPGTTTAALSYQFKTAFVASDEVSVDSTNNTPLEKVTFAVASIAESFATGSGAPKSGGWDQVTNSPDPTAPLS
jgi:hypothetical protein